MSTTTTNNNNTNNTNQSTIQQLQSLLNQSLNQLNNMFVLHTYNTEHSVEQYKHIIELINKLYNDISHIKQLPLLDNNITELNNNNNNNDNNNNTIEELCNNIRQHSSKYEDYITNVNVVNHTAIQNMLAQQLQHK